MKSQVNDTTVAYLSRFYEPRVTAYEFLKYFFAFLGKAGVHEVERDLVSFLYQQKQDEVAKDVLEEINFRSNGVNYYSDDVEDALFNLQNGGLLGKMNPSFGKLIVKYTADEVSEIIDSIPEEFRPIIENIAEAYQRN